MKTIALFAYWLIVVCLLRGMGLIWADRVIVYLLIVTAPFCFEWLLKEPPNAS